MLIPQELQLSLESTQKNERKAQRKNIKAQFENLGELVKNTIFVA